MSLVFCIDQLKLLNLCASDLPFELFKLLRQHVDLIIKLTAFVWSTDALNLSEALLGNFLLHLADLELNISLEEFSLQDFN